jgi:hypothetical protein
MRRWSSCGSKVWSKATDGNLGAHLDTLEKAGYVRIEKRFVARRPQTRVCAARDGRRAFAEHMAYLKYILQNTGAGP